MCVSPGSRVFDVQVRVSDDVAGLAESAAVTYSLDIAEPMSSLPIGGVQSGGTIVLFGARPLRLCHLIKAGLIGAGEFVAFVPPSSRSAIPSTWARSTVV